MPTTTPLPAAVAAPLATPNPLPVEALRHSKREDMQALLTATLFMSFAVLMFSHTGLLTGGTAGVAFLIHYTTGWSFGLVMFVVNVPFYILAWQRMGRAFTLKTALSVGLPCSHDVAQSLSSLTAFGFPTTSFRLFGR